ncbi:MAG: CcmD family protein [Flavobacteriales bacterium]|jgi:CcmD family protein|tara:strand:- start:55 stop:267 length:213 start_codon:yes stop_codon:yes gene_type:complete
MIKKSILILFSSFFIAFRAIAQEVEMASGLRSEGKIYVVVGVLSIIFIGIVVYLISIDKKVTKLEKKINK